MSGEHLHVDVSCKSPNCGVHEGAYTMVGRCSNCRTDLIEITYSRGERAFSVKCPVCGVDDVHPQMLAAP